MAAGLVVAGLVLTGVGVAGAASSSPKFALITFVPTHHEVTLTIPTPPCKAGPPGCVWRLTVNEPFAPGAPALGQVTGTTGTLVVTYPATVCGTTVQGDASVQAVAGGVWRYKIGHRTVVPACPPPASTTTTTTKPGAVTPGATTTVPAAATTSVTDPTPARAVQTAALAQLPFTGIDIEPIGLIGMACVLAGLLLATRFEQRRRTLRRLRLTAQVQRLRAGRASRWFLGE
jgi:hypothetical protein